MVNGLGAIVIPIAVDAVWTGDPLSLTVAVKFDVPLAVGFPEMTPEAESVSPAGRLPEVTAHVYEGVPPLADNVCE